MATVLIVDDIELNRLLLERILTPRGFRTISADGGRMGVDLAQSHQPNLILKSQPSNNIRRESQFVTGYVDHKYNVHDVIYAVSNTVL